MSAEGIGKFFSDPMVQQMAASLFASREGAVWMPARGAFAFQLPAPKNRGERYLGVVRGIVSSPEAAITAFRDAIAPKIGDARRRGQISHEILVRLTMPGEPSRPELIGLDMWFDAHGMSEHYKQLGAIYEAFVGQPQASVWEPATGGVWSEW